MLFVQVECKQSKETLDSKNMWGLGVACIGISICWVFMLTVGHLGKLDRIDEAEVDTSLITVDDYTAQVRLPPGF